MSEWWAIKEKRLRTQYEQKLERIKDFLLKEFGDDLRKQIKSEIKKIEIDKLMPEAKARVLKGELPKLKLEVQKEYEAKFLSMMLTYIDGFFSDFVPRKEETVVLLFQKFQKELGFDECEIKHGDYDCLCTRNGQEVRIEFERKSTDFFTHGHDEGKLDLIVCWIDNIADSRVHNMKKLSIPILELSIELPKIIGRLRREVENK